MIERAFEIFGRSAFGHNLFTNNKTAIRFELALGDTRIERFDTALHRASTVARHIFKDSDDLYVCLTYYGSSLTSAKQSFRTLEELEVRVNRPYFVDREHVDDDWFDDDLTRIFFESDFDSVHRMIWGAVGQELGIRPGLGFNLYIFDSSERILMHPYDDRGMDILGPNRERTSKIYSRFFRLVARLRYRRNARALRPEIAEFQQLVLAVSRHPYLFCYDAVIWPKASNPCTFICGGS